MKLLIGGWLACIFVLTALAPSAAYAGDWVQVSCVNPNGSIAPSEGWTNFGTNTPEPGSNSSTDCRPGSPMYADLSSQAPAYVSTAGIGTSEDLQYAPPAGSMLVGGSLDIYAYGDGYGPSDPGATGSGDALLFTPTYAFGGDNVFFQCAWENPTPCSKGNDPAAFSGVVAVPPNRGGNFTVTAACGGNPQTGVCDQNASGGAWASMQVIWSRFLLFNGSSPGASGFGGSLLARHTYGTADVSFTGADPGGPGVYNVTVLVDGNTAYSATPDPNSGHCVPVGTDAGTGAMMFDYQQPCPATESVDVPVDTVGLRDGEHQLVVKVTDAAQNTSTVLDRTITTQQSGAGRFSTPEPRRRAHRLKVKLVIRWRYRGAQTRLLSVKAFDLPRRAHITVRCRGRGCPRHSAKTARGERVSRLWKALAGQVLRAGDRETFTITAPGRTPERIRLSIRDDAGPVAKLL